MRDRHKEKLTVGISQDRGDARETWLEGVILLEGHDVVKLPRFPELEADAILPETQVVLVAERFPDFERMWQLAVDLSRRKPSIPLVAITMRMPGEVRRAITEVGNTSTADWEGIDFRHLTQPLDSDQVTSALPLDRRDVGRGVLVVPTTDEVLARQKRLDEGISHVLANRFLAGYGRDTDPGWKVGLNILRGRRVPGPDDGLLRESLTNF